MTTQKTAIVTGANSGIGKETAKALLQQGFTIIMICRNRQKAEAVMHELQQMVAGAVIHLFITDLSLVKEVKQVAGEISTAFKSIDVLVNNAGAIFKNRELTADGYEKTFATNHLSCFQLTNLLLPLLQAAPSARIVNVASQLSKFARLNFADLQLEKKYSAGIAYGNSKLMNILFTCALAKKLNGTNITVNAMHPGGVRTNFGGSLGRPMKIYYQLFGWTMRTPEKGADTVVWLASSPEIANETWKYYMDRKQIKPVSIAYDEGAQQKLWAATEELINAKLGQ